MQIHIKPKARTIRATLLTSRAHEPQTHQEMLPVHNHSTWSTVCCQHRLFLPIQAHNTPTARTIRATLLTSWTHEPQTHQRMLLLRNHSTWSTVCLQHRLFLQKANSQHANSQNHTNNPTNQLDTRASNPPKDATRTQPFNMDYSMSPEQVVLANANSQQAHSQNHTSNASN